MRRFVAASVLLVLCMIPLPAAAQEAEALRRELAQMREQFERARRDYERALETVSERLRRLEAQPERAPARPSASAPPPAVPPTVAQVPPAPPPPTPVTPMELLRPRQPFSLSERRGTGQFLFDIGVSGDFAGNITQRNVDKADGGSFPGRENRFFPREVELNLFGQIDPYARGEMRIEAGEEEPAGEVSVRLSEAHLTLLALPYGTQVKLGQMRNRFGLLNEHHRDGLPQTDVPNVLLRFLGEEGLVERGAELTWVPDLPIYLAALLGIFDGDNETAFGRGKLNEPLVTGRLRSFFELTDTDALQVGLSAAHGLTEERRSSTLLGFDAKYKHRPDGWLHPLFTLGGEAIYSIRRTSVSGDIDTDGDGVPDTTLTENRTRHRFGWYGWAELQPWRRWAFGARYDSTQYPELPGREWAVEPYVTFFPSEFLRFRLGYKHTDRSHRDGFTTNGGSARLVDELLFQATFVLGAHPAHPF